MKYIINKDTKQITKVVESYSPISIEEIESRVLKIDEEILKLQEEKAKLTLEISEYSKYVKDLDKSKEVFQTFEK